MPLSWLVLHTPAGVLEPEHEVAFWLLQVSMTVPPEVTEVALLERVTAGAAGVGDTSMEYVPAWSVAVALVLGCAMKLTK